MKFAIALIVTLAAVVPLSPTPITHVTATSITTVVTNIQIEEGSHRGREPR